MIGQPQLLISISNCRASIVESIKDIVDRSLFTRWTRPGLLRGLLTRLYDGDAGLPVMDRTPAPHLETIIPPLGSLDLSVLIDE